MFTSYLVAEEAKYEDAEGEWKNVFWFYLELMKSIIKRL